MSKQWILVLAVLVAACGAGEPPAEEDEAPAESSDAAVPQGRAETQAIRETAIPGHDSQAIADQVDATLNQAEERKREMESQADE